MSTGHAACTEDVKHTQSFGWEIQR